LNYYGSFTVPPVDGAGIMRGNVYCDVAEISCSAGFIFSLCCVLEVYRYCSSNPSTVCHWQKSPSGQFSCVRWFSRFPRAWVAMFVGWWI